MRGGISENSTSASPGGELHIETVDHKQTFHLPPFSEGPGWGFFNHSIPDAQHGYRR